MVTKASKDCCREGSSDGRAILTYATPSVTGKKHCVFTLMSACLLWGTLSRAALAGPGQFVFRPSGVPDATTTDWCEPANWGPYGVPGVSETAIDIGHVARFPEDQREAPAGNVGTPPGFEIVRITNDDDQERYLHLNDCAEVVYRKLIYSGWQYDVFLHDNGVVSRLTNDPFIDSLPDINNDSQVVWDRSTNPGANRIIVLRNATGEIVEITDGQTDDRSPRISNQGPITWQRWYDDGCWGAHSEIMLFDGQHVLPITNDGSSNQSAMPNDQGLIVWTRYDFCVDPWVSDILLRVDGDVLQLTDGQVEPQIPCINNHNQVVWGGPGGIELWDNGVTTLITNWGRNPHINDYGDIFFLRWHDDSGTWHAWYYTGGEFYQLSDDDLGSSDGDINNYGEVAWLIGPLSHRDICMMRRIRTGDMDFNGRVDSHDYRWWAGCATGPVETDRLCECRFLDIDHDRDVDLADFAIFQRNFMKGTQAAATSAHP